MCFASQAPGSCSASLFASPLPCTCFICYVVCFASQSSVLCSAHLFNSLPLFAHVCLFAGVLHLANHDVARCCFSFAPFEFCSLIRSLYFMVIFCFAYFALQASGLRSAFAPFPVTCMIFFPSAILRFRIFCLSTGFCLLLFSLSSHFLAYLLVI